MTIVIVIVIVRIMIRGEGNFKKITNKKKQNHLLDMIRSSWPQVYTVVTE